MLKVGFIGLGTMGYPIAGHISKYYETVVFNRTIKKSQKWTSEFDGEICKSVEDLVSKSNIILICLSEDKDIEEIVLTCFDYSHIQDRYYVIDSMEALYNSFGENKELFFFEGV